MKRLTLLFSLTLALLLAACSDSKNGTVALTSEMDSLSYAVGVSIAHDYKLTPSLPHITDSVNRPAFFEGIDEGIGLGTDKKQMARLAGYQTIQQMANTVKGINRVVFGGDTPQGISLPAVAEAFINYIEKKDTSMLAAEANMLIQSENRSADIAKLAQAVGVSMADGMLQHGILDSHFTLGADDLPLFAEQFKEAMRAAADEQHMAQGAGLVVGRFIMEQRLPVYNKQLFGDEADKTVDVELVVAAFKHAIANAQPLMTLDQATACQERFNLSTTNIKFADNKTAGEQFLAANKDKEGVQTTASGLQYKVLTPGDGPKPVATSVVTVNYEGRLIDGTVFDSSYERGKPLDLPLNQVIDGWTEALQMMQVGAEWELYIPQELAYGAQELGTIKPFSALIFKVQLLGIKK